MRFTLTNKTVHLDGTPQELVFIKDYLRVPVKDRFFVARRSRYGWDGTVEFFNTRTGNFSRGLWPQVRWMLKESGIAYEFRAAPAAPLDLIERPQINPTFTLRPDQQDALNKWLKRGAFGVLWCPPGWGKTEGAAAALAHLRDKYSRALFIVNSLDLLLQAEERFKLRLNQDVGLIGDNNWNPKRITVATIQTLYNAVKKKDDPRHNQCMQLLKQADFIVCDEVHHAKSSQVRTVLSRAGGRYLMGLSARPFHNYSQNVQEMTAEDAIILACLGPVVAYIGTSDLIDKGQLARPQVLLIPVNHPMAEGLDWPATRRQLFSSKPLLETVTQLTRAAADADQASLVIAANSLDFNKKIHRHLIGAGINAVELCGNTDKDLRAEARHSLNDNQIQAIVATTIYDEGVDLPNLRQLILAYGGKSLIKADQRTGRALRKKSIGANVAVIVDMMNYGNKHLYNHSLTRLKRYLEERSYDLFIVQPEQHSPYIQRLLKDRAQPLTALPDAEYYKRISLAQGAPALAAP